MKYGNKYKFGWIGIVNWLYTKLFARKLRLKKNSDLPWPGVTSDEIAKFT